MGPKLVASLLVLVFICSSLGCDKSHSTTSSEIRLGAVLSLTGPAGEQGSNILSGIELAIDDLKSQGINVRLVTEDDQTVAAKTVASLLKVIQASKVQAVIGGTWDYLAEASYPVALRLKVPFLTVTNPIEIISEEARANRFIFTSSLSLAEEGRAIEGLIERLSPKTLGLVFPNIPWGHSRAELLRGIAAKLNLPIVSEYEFGEDGNAIDGMRLAALGVSQKKPDLVYGVLDYNGIDHLTSELSRLNVSPYIVTTQHLDTAFAFMKDPMRLKKVYGIYPAPPPDSFVEKYRAKFGREPRVYAAHGYDGAMFLGQALSQGVDLTSDTSSFKFEGLMGTFELPAKSREVATSKAVIASTVNGRFEFER